MAGACRTVFEINLRVRLMTRIPELIREFQVECVFEEIELIKAIRRLPEADTRFRLDAISRKKTIESFGC